MNGLFSTSIPGSSRHSARASLGVVYVASAQVTKLVYGPDRRFLRNPMLFITRQVRPPFAGGISQLTAIQPGCRLANTPDPARPAIRGHNRRGSQLLRHTTSMHQLD